MCLNTTEAASINQTHLTVILETHTSFNPSYYSARLALLYFTLYFKSVSILKFAVKLFDISVLYQFSLNVMS